MISQTLQDRKQVTLAFKHQHSPQFFRLEQSGDKAALEELLSKNPEIMVFDELDDQVKELVKLRNPKKTKFSETETHQAITTYYGEKAKELHGVWVYYPWANRIVHILDELEFVEVRTNRNRNKITIEEQEKLSKLKVGLIGLSVGQSVSVTMAMERGFGEIRLADFDLLELTNLNRIRTGVHNLGVPKVVSVAREIAEIDPFLKVICFPNGLTEENMDKFFLDGGKLDMLIDECDGLDIKILCRHKAKALKIPVVMEASDRCMLDVERFDREPERPILHGLIDHLDIEKIKTLTTNEEKVPYLLPMIGIDTISPRLKASMIEIGQTLTTWPQLASAVTLGGGLTADVCRRIALDQFQESGRYYVDVDELVSNREISTKNLTKLDLPEAPELATNDMKALANQINLAPQPKQVNLTQEQLSPIVEAACLAPSAGNNQPWRWFYHQGTLLLFHDRSITVSFGDFQDMVAHLGLGTALENLVLKTHEQGYDLTVEPFPLENDQRMIAIIRFFEQGTSNISTEPHAMNSLVNTIGVRCTNRKKGNKEAIDKQYLKYINNAVMSIPGPSVHFVDQESDIRELADIIGIAERMRFMHPKGHYEVFNKELRWDHEDALKGSDGIEIDSLELSASDEAGLRVARDPEALALLNQWKGGKAFEKLSRNAVSSSSAVGFITMPDFSPVSCLNGGRAVQRAWLAANEKGLSFHPVSIPLFLFARLYYGQGEDLTADMKAEILQIRERFVQLFPFVDNKRLGELFLFRLSKAEPPSVQSLRKPLSELLIFE